MSSIQKLIKHDKYLEYLYGKLAPNYDVLLKKVPIYSRRRRLIAEIDILGISNGKCDVFEVKCSHRPTKARHQLDKIRRLLPKTHKPRHLYFYCGESGQLLDLKSVTDSL